MSAVLEENSAKSMNQTPLSGPELAAAMKVGSRVVKGADWKWGNQDGPPPGEGTIVEIKTDGWIRVKWDSGTFNNYRMGGEGKYDLKFADQLYTSMEQIGLDVLSSNFKTLYGCTNSCDMTIVVGEQKYPVHKIILGARSSVFAAMFRHDMDEVKSGIINVPDCDPTAFNDFLLYLYCGKVENLSSSNACHLYKIADKYNVQELKGFCMQYLKRNISTTNLFDVIILANQFDETELIPIAQEVFKKNALEIIKKDDWEQFLKQNFFIANQLLINMLENMKI